MKPQLLKGLYSARLAVASAAIGAYALVASPSPASAQTAIACDIVEIAVFGPPFARIHIKCATPAQVGPPGHTQNIFFFAMNASTFDASRVLSLGETASVTRRRLTILFNPDDLSGQAAIGCNNGDCRLILGVVLPGQ